MGRLTMNALLALALLAQVSNSGWAASPEPLALAGHKTHEPAKATCACSDCTPCRCGDLAVKVAALEAELSNLRAKAPKADAPRPAPAATPADRWVTYAANPRYEVLGHDEGGVFRYSQIRPKVAPAGAACPPGALQ
jgi:hypothetical protein